MTVAAKKVRDTRAKKISKEKVLPTPKQEVTKPLDERKREANRRHKLKADALKAGMGVDDFVKERYNTTVDEFVTDDFQQNLVSTRESKMSTASIESYMATVDISETNMRDVKVDKTKLVPIPSGTPIDRLFSRHLGIMPGTVNIITGEPSAGKTTICSAYLIHALKHPANDGLSAGILNGEMSMLVWEEECEKNEALRDVPVVFIRDLNKRYKGNEYLAAMRLALNRYKLCVVDSLAVLSERIKDATGMSLKDAMFWLIDEMNDIAEKEYKAFLVIQHFSKGLEYIGPTKLKHDTTSMAYVLFDKAKRPFIIFNKNRRSGGLLHVPLYTVMGQNGLLGFDEERLNNYLHDLDVIKRKDELARTGANEGMASILQIEQDFISKMNDKATAEGHDDEDDTGVNSEPVQTRRRRR